MRGSELSQRVSLESQGGSHDSQGKGERGRKKEVGVGMALLLQTCGHGRRQNTGAESGGHNCIYTKRILSVFLLGKQ